MIFALITIKYNNINLLTHNQYLNLILGHLRIGLSQKLPIQKQNQQHKIFL